MPGYLYPGVYLEEIGSAIKPIEGVSTSTADLTQISREISSVLRRHIPAWTDVDDDDPGMTLVQLFAFLSETLLYRADGIPEPGRRALARTVRALAALGHTPGSEYRPLQRPAFFAGRLLEAATLQAEQDYHREKMRRHNRAVVGYGVVSGLGVHIDRSDSEDADVIAIEPGYAIDADGEALALPCAARLALRDGVSDELANGAVVTLRFWERPDAPATTTDGVTQPTVFEEACVIGIAPDVVMPAVGLARLFRAGNRWQLDAITLRRRCAEAGRL